MAAEIDLTLLRTRLREMEARASFDKDSLNSGGGGGTYDGMDGWQTSVEARLSEVKAEVRGLRDEARTDFRVLFAALIATTLGLAALMAKGFHWI